MQTFFFLACFHSHIQHCRYDNRATDLTKDGMRHGIEGAAAFLVFLSEGILDRPFCEWLPFGSLFFFDRVSILPCNPHPPDSFVGPVCSPKANLKSERR
jgi:hypothetical protein